MPIVSSRLARISCQSRPGPFEIQQLLSRTVRGDSRSSAEAQAYLASRWRKPKPSERVLVAVKVSNSIGAGYGVAAVAAGVW